MAALVAAKKAKLLDRLKKIEEQEKIAEASQQQASKLSRDDLVKQLREVADLGDGVPKAIKERLILQSWQSYSGDSLDHSIFKNGKSKAAVEEPAETPEPTETAEAVDPGEPEDAQSKKRARAEQSTAGADDTIDSQAPPAQQQRTNSATENEIASILKLK